MTEYLTVQDDVKNRHEIRSEFTARFISIDQRLERLEKMERDTIDNQNSIQNMQKDIREVKETLKEFVTWIKNVDEKKVDQKTFDAWKLVAIFALTIIGSGLIWTLTQLYQFKSDIGNLPYETAKILKDDWNFNK